MINNQTSALTDSVTLVGVEANHAKVLMIHMREDSRQIAIEVFGVPQMVTALKRGLVSSDTLDIFTNVGVIVFHSGQDLTIHYGPMG